MHITDWHTQCLYTKGLAERNTREVGVHLQRILDLEQAVRELRTQLDSQGEYLADLPIPYVPTDPEPKRPAGRRKV